jgi:hypothetical protein
MQPNGVLNPYEFQRLVFSEAVEFGWPGLEPLMLGDVEADEAFQNAFRFLKSLERSEAMLETSKRPGVGSEFQPAH